jgi:hypothetical protein
MNTETTVIHCSGCKGPVNARLTDGAEIYPHRQDLHRLPFWRCDSCGNYVTGDTLLQFEKKAANQDDLVLAFFQRHRRKRGWTPSEVHSAGAYTCTLTSTRRAISNLTRDGLLRKTEDKRIGPFGRPEHVWRLYEPVQVDLFS